MVARNSATVHAIQIPSNPNISGSRKMHESSNTRVRIYAIRAEIQPFPKAVNHAERFC